MAKTLRGLTQNTPAPFKKKIHALTHFSPPSSKPASNFYRERPIKLLCHGTVCINLLTQCTELSQLHSDTFLQSFFFCVSPPWDKNSWSEPLFESVLWSLAAAADGNLLSWRPEMLQLSQRSSATALSLIAWLLVKRRESTDWLPPTRSWLFTLFLYALCHSIM